MATRAAARKRPVEYSILYTATLCLLAGGAVHCCPSRIACRSRIRLMPPKRSAST